MLVITGKQIIGNNKEKNHLFIVLFGFGSNACLTPHQFLNVVIEVILNFFILKRE
jgi:hypothetical protein